MIERLAAEIEAKYLALQEEMADPEVYSDQSRYTGISKAHSDLEEAYRLAVAYRIARSSFEEAEAILDEGGLDPEMGLTTFFDYEAAIKREMIRSARQIILVADSTKFGKISVTHFAELDAIHTIITDDGLSDEYRRIIVDRGIELIIAYQEDSH